jgi:hypothetical protein
MVAGLVIATGIFQFKQRQTSRGDWMAIELFLSGIRGWEVGLQRWMNHSKPQTD